MAVENFLGIQKIIMIFLIRRTFQANVRTISKIVKIRVKRSIILWMSGELILEKLEKNLNEFLWLAKIDSHSFFHPKIFLRQIQ